MKLELSQCAFPEETEAHQSNANPPAIGTKRGRKNNIVPEGSRHTNRKLSLGKVVVSLTHTMVPLSTLCLLPCTGILFQDFVSGPHWQMKYAEKDTYVVLFLQTPYLLVVGSLIAFFSGVVLASLTEVSFNWLVIIFPFLKFQSQMIGECITLSISSVKLTLLAIELSLIFICL